MVSATLRRQATHVQCALGSLGGGIRDEAARSVAKRGALRGGQCDDPGGGQNARHATRL